MNICRQQSLLISGKGPIAKRFKTGSQLAMIALVVMSLGASALAVNAIPTINNPLVPGQKGPGAAAFTLTVNGSNFVSGATVYWNGNARTTTFVNSAQVTASITAADIATAGTANVTVGNPAPGGGFSNVAHFQIVKNGYTVAFGKLDYTTDSSPQDAVTSDFNGDGKADLAVATGNNSVSVLLGVGDGTFPTHVEYGVPGHPIAILARDFNNDGKIDLATVDEFTSKITILLGNGDGTFAIHHEFATGNHPAGFAAADVNGDGKLDLVVADLNDGKVAVLLGNGDGSLQNHVDYAAGTDPSAVAIADFNGDGKLDLVVANNGDDTVAILLGNGDGTFQGAVPFPVAHLPNSVVVGDFNADGKLDLALGNSNKSVSVLLGNGDGTFQNHKEFTIGANSVIVAAGDLNSDGKLDLISADFNDNTVSTLVGNADGTFKGRSVFPTAAGPHGLAVGDFNGNGKLDLAVVAETANKVSVFTDSPITLTPNVLGFGKNTSGFTTAPKTVTVKNTGTTSYTMGTISFVGSFATDFTIPSGGNTCGATVAAGASCTINVVFTPTQSEVADAEMLITATNGSVLGVLLTGTGNIPITLTPRTQAFGYWLLGTTSTPKSNTFTNDSGVDIIFTKIDLEGVDQDEFTIDPASPCMTLTNATLHPGASCVSNVTFHPTRTGHATVTFVYYGNFSLVKQGLLINGDGTAVKVSPTSLNFGTVTVGTSSSPKTVTFQNAGSVALAISSVTFTGANNDWTQTNTCNFPGGSVPANSSCTFSVVFTPGGVGARSATMNIGEPDPNGPQHVTLSGTGQ